MAQIDSNGSLKHSGKEPGGMTNLSQSQTGISRNSTGVAGPVRDDYLCSVQTHVVHFIFSLGKMNPV